MIGKGPHDITLGNDARDASLVINHDNRADAVLRQFLRDALHRFL